VVNERAHGHARQQLGQTANVIGVVVGEEQIVDLRHTRIFRG